MGAVAEPGIGALRARFGRALAERLDGHIERLGWDAERLRRHQRERLRALLARAIEHSPFHASRLHGIDSGRFELEQLSELPVMSKAQMMESFDQLLTDRQLTRAMTEQQLEASALEPALAYGKYVCLASGGSSGLRGVFAQSVEEYAEFAASVLRRAMARARAAGGPPPEGLPVTIVAAASPVHSSGFAAAVACGPPVRMTSVPATLPVQEIVRRLNEAQPPIVLAHASTLVLLADEQQAGRLLISPRSITSMSEMLSDTDRIAVRDAFGVPPIDQFVSTEGLVGHTEPGSTVFSFATDMCIVELVDEHNRPVPDGVASAKALVTNLHNRTQPLIRYELNDHFIRHPSGGDPFLRAAVEGRADDAFRYGSMAIEPLLIRGVLVRTPAVLEYQVLQTRRGIEVTVVSSAELDHAALSDSLRQSLRSAGLLDPDVLVRRVKAIPRDPQTGKPRRFVAQ